MSLLKVLFPKRYFKPPVLPEEPFDPGDVETGEIADERIEDDETVSTFCNLKEMKLTDEHLRLVVITENEKRVLFDSNTVLPVTSLKCPPPKSQLSKCQKFYLLRHQPDLQKISTMIFGCLSKPDSFKMHHIRDVGIMITRIISVPKQAKLTHEGKPLKESTSSSESESPYSSVHSCDGNRRAHRSSTTMDPPEKFTRVRNASLQLDHEFPRPFSPQSLSTARRKQLSHRGDICDENNCGRWSSRSRMSSCSSANDEEMNHVAVAVIFDFDERDFLMQHVPLVELELLKLEAQVTKGCLTRTRCLIVIHQAWREMVRNLCLLHNAPRIQRPVWLSLLEEEKNENVAGEFCSTLAELISAYDLKTTAYFLSNLVSSVLINHLTWVASVASPDYCAKTRESFILGTKLDVEIFRYPYNTQLAQYMEISGSVGAAQRLARTVILGDDMSLVTKLIYVLSYFVRCSALRTNAMAADAWAQTPMVNRIPRKPKPCPVKINAYYPGHPVFNEAAALRVLNAAKRRQRNGFRETTLNNEWDIPEFDELLLEAESEDKSLARSLIVGPCEAFCSHFVLSGLRLSSISMNETLSSMIDHVKNGESELFCPSSSPESSSSSGVSDPSYFKPTVIVVGDTSNFTVKVFSGDETNVDECPMSSPCEAIVSMFEQFSGLYDIGTMPSTLIAFLEDSLGNILAKSMSLLELVAGRDIPTEPSDMSSEHVAKIIGCDCSDLRLISNAAAVYFPPVLNLLV